MNLRTLSEKQKNTLTLVVVCCTLLGGALLGLSTRYTITFNTTESLGYTLFLTNKTTKPNQYGQFVKFMMPKNKYMKRGHWTKRIVGVPGDVISVVDRTVFINGKQVGIAKAVSATGKRYYPILPGIIPDGFYYVQADHEDSYDSRYKSLGLIHESTFIGRDYPIFSAVAFSKDFGTQGTVFPIREAGAVEAIIGELQRAADSGELDAMNQKFKKKALERVKRPKVVSHLVSAIEYRTFLVDMTKIITEDSWHEGKLVAKAGERINPLTIRRYPRHLLIINGDNPDEVDYALQYAKEHPSKIILSQGSRMI